LLCQSEVHFSRYIGWCVLQAFQVCCQFNAQIGGSSTRIISQVAFVRTWKKLNTLIDLTKLAAFLRRLLFFFPIQASNVARRGLWGGKKGRKSIFSRYYLFVGKRGQHGRPLSQNRLEIQSCW
jgi:hypothetical protein